MSTRSIRRIPLLRSALLAFVGLTITASAQMPGSAPAPVAKPELNGTWKLNVAKSEFSPAPTPSAQTEVISVAGDTLTVAVTSAGGDGNQKFTYSLKIGGPEVPFPKPELNDSPLAVIALKAEWVDASLVITQKITYQNGPGTLVSTYTLSPDGKVLTKTLNVAITEGFFELKAIYDKA
jgi:hypothetical protein